MDVHCRFCREPWEHDTIHEEVAERKRIIIDEMPPGARRERRLAAQTYNLVYEEFRRFGCGAFVAFASGGVASRADDRAQLERCPRAVDSDAGRDPAIGVIQDLLGDDVDGAMSLIEDFGLI